MITCIKKRAKYLIRISDGYLQEGDHWRSIKSIINRKIAKKHRGLDYYYENKSERNEKRQEHWQANAEKTKERTRIWYHAFHERERVKEIERRNKRNPSKRLNLAISRYRSCEIGIDELNRQLDSAIKQADEIYNQDRSPRG